MAESIRWFDTIDSTNTRLVALHSELPDRTVYAARFQTAGRGQQGNRWESRAGENLMFSILLKPDFLPASDQFILSQIVALGLLDYLQSRGLTATIKWPNDIYAGDRKICGTLIETGLADKRVSWAVTGIGLNVNQQVFDPSLPNPTSMTLETAELPNRGRTARPGAMHPGPVRQAGFPLRPQRLRRALSGTSVPAGRMAFLRGTPAQ